MQAPPSKFNFQARAVFQGIDVDDSGYLDHAEFCARLSDLGLTDSEITELYSFIDKDQDGYVSRREFITGFKGWQSMLFGDVPPLLIKSMYPRKHGMPACTMYTQNGVCNAIEVKGACDFDHPPLSLAMALKAPNDLCRMFSSANLSVLNRNIEILTGNTEHALVYDLDRLLERGVMSAPMYSPAADDYVGTIDMRDVIAYMLLLKQHVGAGAHFSMTPLQAFVARPSSGGDDKGYQLVFASPSSSLTFWPLHPLNKVPITQTVLFAAKQLASGRRRVVVTDENNQLKFVLSQSELVRFVMQYTIEGGATLSELGLCEKEVYSVRPDQPVLDCLILMDQKNVAGVSRPTLLQATPCMRCQVVIVDKERRCLGIVCNRDFKIMLKKDVCLDFLDMKCSEFIEEYKDQGN